MVNLKEILLNENVGGLDLFIRALLGSFAITALAAGIMKQSKLKWLLAIIGFAGVFTSLTRHCTPYNFLGINTAKKGNIRCDDLQEIEQDEV